MAKLEIMGIGGLQSPAVKEASPDWTLTDSIGAVRCRTSAFRTRYIVEPGLHSLGTPSAESDVFVSANYKLSFDHLRRSLKGIDAWILVLDTKGINVWCAAGKGTFGTAELLKRIREARLDRVVSHRRIIVPQLGAVGVNASEVQKQTGFRVLFGPVAARDIPAYTAAGHRKTVEMRLVRFGLLDRLVLTPMEINPAMKKFPFFGLIVLILAGLEPSGIIFSAAWSEGLPLLLLGLASVASGAFLTPLLLPFIPSRSFAVKGWIMGMLTVTLGLRLSGWDPGLLLTAVSYLFFPMVSSYLGLQFTGSTTFTGMSGVKKELRFAIPLYLASTALSVILLVTHKLISWKVL